MQYSNKRKAEKTTIARGTRAGNN